MSRPTPSLPPEFAALAERFWPRVLRSEIGKRCWFLEVKGRGAAAESCYSARNRPRFTIGILPVPAIKVAWELSGRGTTAGVRLVNTCGDEGCINPEHFTATPYQEASRGTGIFEILTGHAPTDIRPAVDPSPAASRATEIDRIDASLLVMLSEPGVSLERVLVTPWGRFYGTDVRAMTREAHSARPLQKVG